MPEQQWAFFVHRTPVGRHRVRHVPILQTPWQQLLSVLQDSPLSEQGGHFSSRAPSQSLSMPSQISGRQPSHPSSTFPLQLLST